MQREYGGVVACFTPAQFELRNMKNYIIRRNELVSTAVYPSRANASIANPTTSNASIRRTQTSAPIPPAPCRNRTAAMSTITRTLSNLRKVGIKVRPLPLAPPDAPPGHTHSLSVPSVPLSSLPRRQLID